MIGVDGSAAMVREAGERLADLAPRVTVRRGDLLELEVEEPVDLWSRRRPSTGSSTTPGCSAASTPRSGPAGAWWPSAAGGQHRRDPRGGGRRRGGGALRRLARRVRGRWLFAGAEETVARLGDAGFEGARAWLEEAPAVFADVDAGAEFLATVVLRHHLERLPASLRAPFARDVAARRRGPDGRVVVDYVRLNMEARRPAP